MEADVGELANNRNMRVLYVRGFMGREGGKAAELFLLVIRYRGAQGACGVDATACYGTESECANGDLSQAEAMNINHIL